MNRKILLTVLSILLFSFLVSPPSSEAAMKTIHYQGRLRMRDDALVNGVTKGFKTRYYDAQVGGSLVLDDATCYSSTVTGGVFELNLAPTISGLSYLNNAAYWMELRLYTAAGCGTLEDTFPREQISASPIAVISSYLSGISGNETNILGEARIGFVTDDNGSTAGYGNLLYLSGGDDWAGWNSDNSDPLYLGRYNAGNNASELRLNIGDDNTSASDKFVVGVNSGSWYPKLTVEMDGTVGINNGSPVYPLDVTGPGSSYNARFTSPDGYLLLGPANNGWAHLTTDRPRFWFSTGVTVDTGNIGSYDENLSLQTSGTTRLTILNSNGYVGIGTAAPAYQLQVSDTIYSSKGLAPADGSESAMVRSNSKLLLYDFGANNWAGIGVDTAGDILFRTGTAASAITTITAGGKVGINTAAPWASLDIFGNSNPPQIRLMETANDYARLELRNNDAVNSEGQFWQIAGYTHNTPSSAKLNLYYSEFGDAMTLVGNGNVGIGTSSPSYKLQITDTLYSSKALTPAEGSESSMARSDAKLLLYDLGANNWAGIGVDQAGDILFRTGTASSAITTIKANGNVGIGTANPTFKLYVNGTAYATNYVCASDRNLKQDIQILDGKTAIEKLKQINGVNFRWKEGDDKLHLGVIAQDVEKVFPEAVTTNDETGVKAVEYDNLIAPLIEAVKEQQKQIEALQQEIEILKKK